MQDYVDIFYKSKKNLKFDRDNLTINEVIQQLFFNSRACHGEYRDQGM